MYKPSRWPRPYRPYFWWAGEIPSGTSSPSFSGVTLHRSSWKSAGLGGSAALPAAQLGWRGQAGGMRRECKALLAAPSWQGCFMHFSAPRSQRHMGGTEEERLPPPLQAGTGLPRVLLLPPLPHNARNPPRTPSALGLTLRPPWHERGNLCLANGAPHTRRCTRRTCSTWELAHWLIPG